MAEIETTDSYKSHQANLESKERKGPAGKLFAADCREKIRKGRKRKMYCQSI